MTKRCEMGNLWALYADGHRGYCLEFENVGPMFEHAKDINYLDLKDTQISVTDPSILSGHFLYYKTREWRCEEVPLVLSRNDGRIKVKFNPVWLKERNPESAVSTTYYDAAERAIKLRDDCPPLDGCR
jgi:hypothetical protein